MLKLTFRPLLLCSALPLLLPRLRLRPTVDMVATVVDTEATATTATVDIVARGRLRPRLLLLPSPRLMLRPTGKADITIEN